ncbi:hypothetical protein TSAR_012870 [Trichomalopsis sarcophagae]|uniref:Uncharacterized protein n=1 Tax=Trichomalopsis sarcophagae TaxID=543379 RepID=A0A232ENP3_9HYME|nr:hypothetical protein TSAR_012870 [Trichomalopsis sarcophagae]
MKKFIIMKTLTLLCLVVIGAFIYCTSVVQARRPDPKFFHAYEVLSSDSNIILTLLQIVRGKRVSRLAATKAIPMDIASVFEQLSAPEISFVTKIY